MTRRPRTPRALLVATGLLLVVAGLLVGVQGASASDCGNRDTRTIDEERTIGSDTTWSCEDVLVQADVTVAEGALLALDDAHVTFEAGTELMLTVASGGHLETDHSTLESASGTAYGISFEDAATGHMTDTLVASPADVAVRVNGASPTLDNVTVRDALNGIVVEGQAQPHLENATTEGVTIGLRATDGARVTAENTSLAAANRGVSLVGDAQLAHRNGTFGENTPTEARLEGTDAGDPRLVLEGTQINASRVAFGPSASDARIETTWYTTVQVLPGDGWPAKLDVSTIEVLAEDRTGDRQHLLHPDASQDNRTPMLALPGQILGPAEDGSIETVEQHNPWTFSVQKDSSANGTTVDLDENQLVEIGLPHDEDDQDPLWEGTAGLSDAEPEGHSSTGDVHLVWAPATDDPDGQHENRAVAAYEILHTPADGEVERFEVPAEGSTATGRSPGTTLTDLAPGTHSFQARPVDLVDNRGDWSATHTVTVDLEPPSLSVTVNGTEGPVEGHHNGSVTLAATAQDERFEKIQFLPEDAPPQANLSVEANFTLAEEGTHNLTVQALDLAHGTTEMTVNFTIDLTTPIVEVSLDPTQPTGEDDWYDEVPQLRISARDRGPSGVHETRYRLSEDAPWTVYNGSTTLEAPGQHRIQVEVADRAGNLAHTEKRVAVDPDPPDTTLELASPDGSQHDSDWWDAPVEARLDASDAASGVDRVEVRLDGEAWTRFEAPLSLDHTGSRTVELRAVDRAGNPSQVLERTVAIDPAPPVAPRPTWTVAGDGQVRVDWSNGPPSEAVSHLAGAAIEVANATASDPGASLRASLEVSPSKTVHEVGPLETGTHLLRATVSDAAGNQATSAWTEVRISTSAAGLSELDAGIARGTETVRYTPPAGFDPVEVQVYVDGSLATSTDEAPYTFAWDTQAHPDGPHTIEVLATDEAGNEHREQRTYEVQNAYTAQVGDGLLPFTAALAAAAGTGGFAAAGYRSWTRWEIA